MLHVPSGEPLVTPPLLPSSTQIVMPAELMKEPTNPNLYNDFSRIATDLNVYTGVDCAPSALRPPPPPPP